jgi:polyisoprenyl-phosphate glycosyltransferase
MLDGSTDGSREALQSAVSPHVDLRILRFSRNFWKEVALSAGLQAARADAVVMLDADLQHPIDVVDTFLYRYSRVSATCVTIPRGAEGTPPSRTLCSRRKPDGLFEGDLSFVTKSNAW